MKLRNLLLTAALFLTAGIVSADVFDENDAGGFFWTNSANTSKLNITLTYYGQGGFTFAAYDPDQITDLNSTTWKNFQDNPNNYAGKIWLLNEGTNTIEFPSTVKTLGIAGMNGSSAQQVVYSTTNIKNNPGWKFYITQNYEILAFDMTADNGGGNYAAEITFGSPLPAPVVTLLIALGFGAAFVMYRNRRQVKA